jgi:hypothetical protein
MIAFERAAGRGPAVILDSCDRAGGGRGRSRSGALRF